MRVVVRFLKYGHTWVSMTPTMTIAIRSGNADRLSDTGPIMHWWSDFRKRHTKLTLRKMDNNERSKADALTPETVNDYFDLLNKTLSENNLKCRPRQLYNYDETFLPLDQTRESSSQKEDEVCVVSVTGNH